MKKLCPRFVPFTVFFLCPILSILLTHLKGENVSPWSMKKIVCFLSNYKFTTLYYFFPNKLFPLILERKKTNNNSYKNENNNEKRIIL
jgi:hypothetical protein